MTNKNSIHPPYAKFKGFLREKGIVYDEIAKTLGLTATTVSQKINGNSDFFLNEIQVLKSVYGIQDDLFS